MNFDYLKIFAVAVLMERKFVLEDLKNPMAERKTMKKAAGDLSAKELAESRRIALDQRKVCPFHEGVYA